MNKLFIFIIFTIFLLSCDLSTNNSVNSDFVDDSFGNFWAQNTSTGKFYRVDAELLAEGTHCNVWAEKGSGVNSDTAEKVAKKYDDNIYSKMLNAFSFENVPYEGKTFADVMEFAGWLLNGDGKLNILLLDIKDDYKKNGNDSYVSGYFWAGNFLDIRYSNKKSMLYVDTYPGLSGEPGQMPAQIPERMYVTIAHEMQHLMNFMSSILYRTPGKTIYTMDTWIDEGLSSAAEWLYGGHNDERIKWYNNGHNYGGMINQGNNFFVWGNRVTKNNPYPILDDYSTVYLFFQWLRLQSGGTDIYRDIITSPYPYFDHRAVTSAADNAMSGKGYNNWETLLKTWLAANFINSPSGPYGYMNDFPTNLTIQANTAPAGENSFSLYPGEGVYSITNNSQPALSGQGANINNAYFNKSPAQVNDSAFYPGGGMLTYNVNTNPKGSQETGKTTGVGASMGIAARSLQAPLSGPFAIGAGDMLRQNGYKEVFGAPVLPKPDIKIEINE